MSSANPAEELPPFRHFSEEEVEAICAAGEVQEVRAGEILFQRDEYGDSMYVVEEGEVELIFVDGKPGKLQSAGEVFGELAFITGRHPRTATARARTACRLRVLGEAACDRLFEARPRLLVQLLRRTCSYLLASEDRLIASLRQKNRELERTLDYLRRTREEVDYQELLANTDELTGLYNRRCLDRQLERFIRRAHDTGEGLALILLDVDEFKNINDTHGHSVGDAALRGVASVIAGCVRASDLPFRFGGDEFAILLTEVEPRMAEDRAETIRRQVEALSLTLAKPQVVATVSVGGAMLRDGEQAPELFDRADRELYRAKEGGRNRVSWQAREEPPPRREPEAGSAATDVPG